MPYYYGPPYGMHDWAPGLKFAYSTFRWWTVHLLAHQVRRAPYTSLSHHRNMRFNCKHMHGCRFQTSYRVLRGVAVSS